MQRLSTIIAGGLFVCSSSALSSNTPNVVIILLDDMGYGDLSVTGASGHLTPHIDKLANEGTLFTHYYSAQPVSSAARVGLLTGCYPHKLGFQGAIMPADTIGICPKHYVLPDMFHEKGYKCFAVGKWHVGHQFRNLPLQNGFDEFFGLPYSNDMWPVGFDGKAITDKNNIKGKYPVLSLMEGNKSVRDINTMRDQEELTTLYTERAVKIIEENKDRPFFLYLAHSMPHVPLAVSDKFKGKSRQGLYGDVMMEIDWSVGQVMKALEDNDIDDNTIVIFTSDNGPWITFGNHGGSNGALREGKLTTYEGGIRLPCIIRWKNNIPCGVIKDQMISGIDILPSLASVIKCDIKEHNIDGINVMPYILDKTPDSQRKIFEYYFRKGGKKEAVRNERFKLVFPHKYIGTIVQGKDGYKGKTQMLDAGFELYDLYQDPGERHNIIELYPEVAKKLKELM